MKKKKMFSLIVLGCSSLLLTGCGNKLSCSMKETQSGVGTLESEVEFEFESDKKKVKSVYMHFDLEYEDGIAEETKKQYENIFGMICNAENAPKDCKVKKNDDKFEFKTTGTAEELGYEEDVDFESLKKELEDSKYNCK